MRRGEAAERATDVVLAGAGLVAAGPVLAAAAVAVRLTMGRPVLYRERRLGRGGRPFELLKLRTMRPLREGETSPESDGARLTRVGRFLRSTSLDELVSLVNVVRGDMSLVGPRPLPVRYLERFDEVQLRRLEVRPGVTGLAQVSGRNALGWEERFELDVRYVDRRSLPLYLTILALTVSSVLSRDGIGHGDHATMPEFLGASTPPPLRRAS